MVIWRCRVPAISNPLSLGTSLKHFPASLSTRPRPQREHSNCVAAPRAVSFFAVEALSQRQKEQIDHYVDALLQWNQVSFLLAYLCPTRANEKGDFRFFFLVQKMNLTAVREVDEVMERHIEDSLAIIPPIQDSYIPHCGFSHKNISVVDVGSGAGLPGLVLAIARPGRPTIPA